VKVRRLKLPSPAEAKVEVERDNTYCQQPGPERRHVLDHGPLPSPVHPKWANAKGMAWVPENRIIHGGSRNESDCPSLKGQVWPGDSAFLEGGGCTLASALLG
jgi:hypothetical protein